MSFIYLIMQEIVQNIVGFWNKKEKEKKICIEMPIYFLMTILGHPNKVKRLASLTLFFFFLRLSFPFQFPWQLTVTVDI